TGQCYPGIQQGDHVCDGCSFTPSGFKFDDIRTLGLCTMVLPGEATNGCPTNQNPQCAWVTCYFEVNIQGGVPICNSLKDHSSGYIYWSTTDTTKWCLNW